MRRDVLTGDWVSIAAARQNRAFLPPAELDPLAPQTPTNPSEIPSRYDVAVFENKSPSFGPALAAAHGDAPAGIDAPRGLDDLDAPGLGRTRTSVGRCEVVCFSPEHSGSFGTLSPHPRPHRHRGVGRPHRRAVRAARHRAGLPVREPRRGDRRHAPPPARPDLRVPLHHAAHDEPARLDRPRGRPTCSRGSSSSSAASERVILQGEHWTAFVPFAARWPLEVHLLPHRHVADFADDDRCGARRARPALPAAAARRRRAVRLPDPVHRRLAPGARAAAGATRVRLHLQLTRPRRAADKLKFLAGSEAAMGAWIGDIPPETSAARLRDAVADRSRRCTA